MYMRLGFAVAIHVDPQILIVDEVLAVGDESFQHKCLDRIRGFQAEGRTIVFVTHSLGTVTDICNRAYLLYKGDLAAEGDPTEVVEDYRRRVSGDGAPAPAPDLAPPPPLWAPTP